MADPFLTIRTQTSVTPDEIDNFADISDYNQSLLQEAISSNPTHSFMLLENGVPLDHQDDNGQTALQYAISRGYYDIAHKILDSGANVELRDVHGNAALWTAVMNPRPDMSLIKRIFEAGGDPFQENNAGRSPMDMVRTKREAELVELFEGR